MPDDPVAIAGEIERRLAALGTPERAAHEKAYLRSDLRFLGTGVPAIRSVVKAVGVDAAPDRAALLPLVDALWHRGVHECRTAAVELLALRSSLLSVGDLGVVEGLLRTARTWALVDPLATAVTARVVERDAAAVEVLDRWAEDDDFWVQRAAMLSLLPQLRSGGGDFDRFARYADAMLDSGEFFLRKAIGWILRDVGRRRPELVIAWLAPRTARASGVTMREAVKHLPVQDRDRLLAAYRAGEAAV